MPYAAGLLGGVLIGLAALLLYAGVGRIAGVSGIAYAARTGSGEERAWRLLFLGGLIGGAWIASLAFGPLPPPVALAPKAAAIAIGAGLLVGFGTRLGNGCTSGHGICGLANLSRRSLAAVLTFMALGMASATLLRPLL